MWCPWPGFGARTPPSVAFALAFRCNGVWGRGCFYFYVCAFHDGSSCNYVFVYVGAIYSSFYGARFYFEFFLFVL